MPEPELVVRAKGVAKRYGDRVVLDGVDLAVHRGARLGLIGPAASARRADQDRELARAEHQVEVRDHRARAAVVALRDTNQADVAHGSGPAGATGEPAARATPAERLRELAAA
jgi:hypothetical protein